MEAEIKKTDTGIEIDVTALNDKQDTLLEAFQECSEGRCTCPTQEYQKVASLQITQGDDQIHLSIIARDDETIDTDEIKKCLDYTRQRVEGGEPAEQPLQPDR